MSETPISDSTPHNVADLGMQIRRIERKLNEANDRIKRLEDAGNALLSHSHCTNYHEKIAEWNEAKRIRL